MPDAIDRSTTPTIIDERVPEQARQLADLSSDPTVTVLNQIEQLQEELADLVPRPSSDDLNEPCRWVYYPWRRTLVKVLGPRAFDRVRLDRNRLKIKTSEQAALRRLRIGVVGLSTGHSIAHGLAVEGLCGHLRISDFDNISLSNLNRIPGSLLDIGQNKTVVLARRIAEIDPYLTVDAIAEGVNESNVDTFVQGLDLIVEQCDSINMKISVRLAARRHRVAVLMETNDRGLFDVERFDLEPDRPIFHGLLDGVDAAHLVDLNIEEKTRYLLKILKPGELSVGAAASMIEVNRTITNWPQLGSETLLGASTVAAAVRRFGSSTPLPSGRIRIDLDAFLDELDPDAVVAGAPADRDGAQDACADPAAEVPADPSEAIVDAARRGPSGGNTQPWLIAADNGRVRIQLSTARTSTLDLAYRGSLVAVGAAAFNAQVAAAKHHVLGGVTVDVESAIPSVELTLSPGEDTDLAALYPAMIRRMSNRTQGSRAAVSASVADRLATAARREGGRLHLITEENRLNRLATVLAESDRIRYLTARLHREMISELNWPDSGRLDLGIDVETLGLTDNQQLLLPMLARPEVMQRLTPEPALGSALGDMTANRVRSASAVAIVTVDGHSTADYIRGGAAVERVWISAQREGLGVYPISPIFNFAISDDDLRTLSEAHADTLGRLQREFNEIGALDGRTPVLVMRLSHRPGRANRSRRLPLSQVIIPFEGTN